MHCANQRLRESRSVLRARVGRAATDLFGGAACAGDLTRSSPAPEKLCEWTGRVGGADLRPGQRGAGDGRQQYVSAPRAEG